MICNYSFLLNYFLFLSTTVIFALKTYSRYQQISTTTIAAAGFFGWTDDTIVLWPSDSFLRNSNSPDKKKPSNFNATSKPETCSKPADVGQRFWGRIITSWLVRLSDVILAVWESRCRWDFGINFSNWTLIAMTHDRRAATSLRYELWRILYWAPWGFALSHHFGDLFLKSQNILKASFCLHLTSQLSPKKGRTIFKSQMTCKSWNFQGFEPRKVNIVYRKVEILPLISLNRGFHFLWTE